MKILSVLFIFLITLSVPLSAQNTIEPQNCIFSSVLGTRGNPSEITMGSGSKSYLDNTTECTLNTSDVYSDNYDHGLACDGGMASATGNYQNSLAINYDYAIQSPNTYAEPGNSNSITVDSSNQVLPSDKYKNIKQNYHHYNFTWQPSGNDIGVNKFNKMLNTVTVDNIANRDLEIGQFIANTYSNTTLNLTAVPKNIQIYKFQTSGSNNFTVQTSSTPGLEATNRIDIDSLFLKSSHNTNLTLKAPTVVIRQMDLNNDQNHITIYADEIDIDEIDFGQHNTLTVHPYTPGAKVRFYSRQINISSSTQMVWDAGDYYVDDFDIAGSGAGISFVKASGPNQIINLFVTSSHNSDFEIGNNFGINSDGTNGNYGSNPAQNFRIFVNGDVTTGGGGTTFNALIYAEGEADLGSPTYLKGSLSTNNDITIGNDSHFEPADDDGGWGSCPTSVTYDNQYTCGLFPSVLTSYTHITSNGNNDQACYTANISYPDGELTGDITCNPSGCGGTSSCQRVNPPLNRYSPSFPTNSKSASANGSNPTELTDLEYGNLTYSNQTIHFNPSQTYSDNDTKVMLLGDVTASKSTLQFEPGDYYFDSLTISSNNNNVKLPNGGPVRIFIKNDFSVKMNNLDFNTNGSQNDLFVYVGGDFKSPGNGGGTTSWKAYMYVAGTTTLNNNSNNWKIYGGITTEGEVIINGNNPDFIQQGDKGESFGYGECKMCYDGIQKGGFQMDFGQCPGMSISFMSTITVPIKTSRNLKNLSVDEAHKKSWASGSFLSSNKVVDQDGNTIRNAQTTNSGWNDGAMGMNMSLFNDSAVTYVLGDNSGNYGPTSDTNYQQLRGSTFFGMNFCSWKESLAYVAHYDDGNRHYDVQLGECEKTDNPTTPYITGPFDAWDTSRDNASTPPTDRNISTKIVNKSFHLSLASLNKTNDAYEKKQGIGNVDVSIYPNGSLTPISNSISFDANTTAHVNSVDFNVTKADKNARVGFKLCTTYENNATTGKKDYILYSIASCSALTTLHECNATTSGTPTWHICYSTDNFAIRPYAFRVFGENQYKHAGEDFNITIKAVDENNNSINSGTVSSVTGVSGYNASLSSLNVTSQFYQPSSADVTQMQSDTGLTDVTTCPNAGTFTINNTTATFANGEANASLKFSETGILDLNISEIPGQEWALVDADDTDNAHRYIQPATVIFDSSNVNKTNLLLFVPYKFDTTAQYNTTNAKNWLYMNDINGSNSSFTTPKMAAFIKYTITAKNKDGAITQNYTKTCFPDTSETNCPRVNGLKLNTTFDLFLDADINSSANANISLYTENNNSIAIYTPLKNKSLNAGNTSIQEWISPKNFESGIGEAKAYFNIDRNISQARNPIKIGLIDANTSTSWMTNPGSPKDFNGSNINQTKTFYYGRTHAPRQRYTGDHGDALIYYEVYCDVANGGDKSLLPDKLASRYTDDPRWFVNPAHQIVSDGKVNAINQRGFTVGSGNVKATAIDGATPTKSTLDYNEAAGYPYKTTMETNSSNWLIYNKYDANATKNKFEVEFINPNSSWAGVHETNSTTKRNAASVTNRRLMW